MSVPGILNGVLVDMSHDELVQEIRLLLDDKHFTVVDISEGNVRVNPNQRLAERINRGCVYVDEAEPPILVVTTSGPLIGLVLTAIAHIEVKQNTLRLSGFASTGVAMGAVAYIFVVTGEANDPQPGSHNPESLRGEGRMVSHHRPVHGGGIFGCWG